MAQKPFPQNELSGDSYTMILDKKLFVKYFLEIS
jgi:hypothetical protein